LIDQGAVEHHEGRFRITERIEHVVIPGTVQDVIMTRVDRLDESARQLLQAASVIGRSRVGATASILQRESEESLMQTAFPRISLRSPEPSPES